MSILSEIRNAVASIVGRSPERKLSDAFAARLDAVSKRDNEVWAECEKWLHTEPINEAEEEQARRAWESWIHQLRYGYGVPMFSSGELR